MKTIDLKKKIKDGKTVIGTWNMIPSPTIVEIIGLSGFDFVIIDAEHGPVGMESAENLVRACEVAQTSAIIRVPSNEPHLILRALDIGACGIQVPHVSTKSEAESVVESSRYHPMGKRGFSPFTRAAKYGADPESYIKKSNEETMVILNVEGVDGLKNLREIASVKGIDVIFLGPYDLSQSFGKPGQVNDPEVINALKNSAKLIKDKGLCCGSFAKDAKYLETLVDCGMQYITYGVDSAIISDTYRELKKNIVKAYSVE